MPATFELPNNVTGGASIPILSIPTPLAAVTTSVGGSNIAVVLRAAIGWQAQNVGINVTNVLFKIWRGAPGTGFLVVSVLDSAESSFDLNRVTSFGGNDFNFSGAQAVTYVLTAELPTPGTAARVIGGMTFTTGEYAQGVTGQTFYFSQLPNNTVGGASIPVTTTPVPLLDLSTSVQAGDTVALRATIGWRATSDRPNVLFKIWRGAPFTGQLIVSALDRGDANFDLNEVTAIDGIDAGLNTAQNAVYVLTAEITDTGAAQVIGALTLTALRFSVGSVYALPNNIAGGALIPLSATPQPLALANLTIPANTPVTIRTTVGWNAAAFPRTDVLFKLWRGAPFTGQLLFSAIDSNDADDQNKVTEIGHVDTGIAGMQSATYILTAELLNPNLSAKVIGPITITALIS